MTIKVDKDGWTRKPKGNPHSAGSAFIWVHPELDRAIVQNCFGVTYDGERYGSVEEAKKFAMDELKARSRRDDDKEIDHQPRDLPVPK